MRRIWTILLCAAAFCGAADRRAPGFSLADNKGEEHDLYDYRGKVVVLAFVQTTCPHCAVLTDNLQKASQRFGDKIAVLEVCVPPDTPDKIMKFVADHKLTFPVLFDQGQMTFSYVRSPNMQFPRLYMIDSEGMIRADYQYGAGTQEIFDGNGLNSAISQVLNGDLRKKAVYYER